MGYGPAKGGWGEGMASFLRLSGRNLWGISLSLPWRRFFVTVIIPKMAARENERPNEQVNARQFFINVTKKGGNVIYSLYRV